MKAIKTLLAASALATITGAANATVWNLEMSATNFFAGVNGNLIMEDFAGTWDDSSNAGSWSGRIYSAGTVALDVNIQQTFSMDESNGKGTLNPFDIATCVDNLNSGSACAGFSGPLSGPLRNTVGTTETNYKTGLPFTPTNGATYTWTLQINKAAFDEEGNPIFVYIPVPMNVTLEAQAAVPVPAAAWLFGSGLLGLAGTARRRRS